ncbi:MAG TPA: response regulator [Candidatus Polarisedimenticolaceae bacterium]
MSRILVVEDEPSLRMLYRSDLSEDGHEVATASNAQEALAQLEEVRPDLVVLDIRMPGMDGLDAMSRILERNPRTAVVLNSAFSCYKENFLSWAADAYVVKSSDTTELRETVRRVLAERERASA